MKQGLEAWNTVSEAEQVQAIKMLIKHRQKLIAKLGRCYKEEGLLK